MELLATSDWPGNVRQLQNVVRQNVAISQTPIIPVELVQQSLGGTQGKLPSFDEARDEFTRSYLSQILQITGGNVSQAARLAKRNRTDFYKLLGRHSWCRKTSSTADRTRGARSRVRRSAARPLGRNDPCASPPSPDGGQAEMLQLRHWVTICACVSARVP